MKKKEKVGLFSAFVAEEGEGKTLRDHAPPQARIWHEGKRGKGKKDMQPSI